MKFDDYLQENPVLNFSIYSSLQIETIRDLGETIIEQFDKMIREPNIVDMSEGNPYGKIWLWIIGAFEIVRTMSDEKWKGSWEEDTFSRILNYKQKLAELRVPFAKQEKRNKKKVPFQNEPSIYGIDHKDKSYLFEARGTTYSIRMLILEFDELIRGISLSDINHDMREND